MSRIVLDLRMVGSRVHGIARYALELLHRLPSLAPHHEFVALTSPDAPREVESGAPGVRFHRCRQGFLDPREQLELPWVVARLAPDLIHWTSFSVSPLARAPAVITLHDANHLAFPENYGPGRRLYYEGFLQPAVARARAVITVSHFAADELRARMAIPEGRLRVISNGVDARFRPRPKEAAALRRALHLPPRFALYVGNTKPHKNVGLLMTACRMASVPLVALVPEPPADRGKVIWLDALADSDLPALYSAATVFAFPSLYEGFGLPPLEAMACGTPAVVSDAASLPEVVGDAAEVLPARDIRAWAAALARSIGHEAGDEHRNRGRRRAAAFTWESAASQTLAVYESALRCAELPSPASNPPPR